MFSSPEMIPLKYTLTTDEFGVEGLLVSVKIADFTPKL